MPDVAAFWSEYASDEDIHARFLEELRRRLSPEQLATNIENELVGDTKRLLTYLQKEQSIEDLDQAYRFANMIETSEINPLFETILSTFEPDEKVITLLRLQLSEHVGKLTYKFPEAIFAPRAAPGYKGATMSDIQEVTVDDLKHLVSDRAIQGETMLLNMGPQHPSTHGVLRLLLELDGETVINCIPDIGFLHTGVEKNMEAKTYQKAEVMSDRLDYMNPVGNNLAYSMAVEKLVDLDVPARAQALRVILAELTRIQSHLVWLGTAALDLAAMSMFLYCFREREYILDIMEMCSGPAHDDHLHPPRRVVAGCAGGIRGGRPGHPQDFPETDRPV